MKSVPAEDLPYGPGNPDYENDGDRQRLDDEANAVLEAFIEGRQAGLLGLGAGLNKYDPGTPLHHAWERGRSSAEAQRASEQLRQRARRSCDPCTCGGRGLCRDAA
jgi:hypothetical protein